MKYYLVNYLILDKKTVTENANMGISLHSFANNELLKKSIAVYKNANNILDNIVIKSYEQITCEAFKSLGNNKV